MKRVPFDPKELIPIGEEPTWFRGAPPRPIYDTPVSPKVNYLALMNGDIDMVWNYSMGIPLTYWGVILYSFILMLLHIDSLKNFKYLSFLNVFKNPLSYISVLGVVSFLISVLRYRSYFCKNHFHFSKLVAIQTVVLHICLCSFAFCKISYLLQLFNF